MNTQPLNERIEAFETYFETMRDENMQGYPFPIDKFELTNKAKELNLPIPYYNENDELVVNWEGYE